LSHDQAVVFPCNSGFSSHKDHSDTNIYVKANELYQLNSYNSYNTIIKLNDSFFLDFIAVNTTNWQ